jgi:hypothetical protein
MDNIYLRLTREFNRGRRRAIVSSGQAVVLHRLAVMSKDGDWILREDEEALRYILKALDGYQARYRFGAPLDLRWMAGGWSAHFEFQFERLRVRTDFITRPPRLSEGDREILWRAHEGGEVPYLGLRDLAEIKKTNREKDYSVIGELARRMTAPREQLLYSRSARDLVELAARHPVAAAEAARERPLLGEIPKGREAVETALDAERRGLIRANEERLGRYARASKGWADRWWSVGEACKGLSLEEAHGRIVREAERLLPFEPESR